MRMSLCMQLFYLFMSYGLVLRLFISLNITYSGNDNI